MQIDKISNLRSQNSQITKTKSETKTFKEALAVEEKK